MKRARKSAGRTSVAQASQRFGRDYFHKFYLSPKTRVVTAEEMRSRAYLIAALLRHAELPVHRILDAGCGIGLLKKPLKECLPKAKYVGLEFSEYLCKRYGWTRGSVTDFAARTPFDLVICYDVMQYLTDEEAVAAMENLAHLSRAAIYVSALTLDDWRKYCDRSRTDGAVHLRSGAWYRRHLRKSFNYLGFGVWLRKDVTAILWDLERR
ncbi:MAG TPA: class I SAM-dependent methyltransferase [Steroidobacteraceae bacterium]|jgi:2-polyprenyl-3-methyl-5-hydroxy-6-metoxy-1,4-benzoquinol methylase